MSQDEAVQFLAAEKVIPPETDMRWRSRNVQNRRCHLPVEASGVRVGEIILVVNVALPRHWMFKLVRRRDELLRWDLAAPPVRHRNPPTCPPDYPPKVRELEHEHLWHELTGIECAKPLTGLANATHKEAFIAFCARANITMLAPYTPPPPLGEQLIL